MQEVLDANRLFWERFGSDSPIYFVQEFQSRKRPREYEESDIDESIVSTESEDSIENELECAEILAEHEKNVIELVHTRKCGQKKFEDAVMRIVSQELSSILAYIRESEEYELATCGRSSWTLRKIVREVRDLERVMQTNYYVPLDISLLKIFAKRVFKHRPHKLRKSLSKSLLKHFHFRI